MNWRSLYNKNKIEITGIIAWVVFTFGAVLLIPLFLTIELPRLLIYIVCYFFFLMYFFAYYRSAFTFKRFLLLLVAFNMGFSLFQWLYTELTKFDNNDYSVSYSLYIIITNIIFSSIVYLIIYTIIRRRRK